MSPPRLSPLTAILSEAETRLDNTGSLRTRVETAIETNRGAASAFVSQELVEGAFGKPSFGLSSPYFDFGPLREQGLVREMNFPSTLGGIREQSRVSIDRSQIHSSSVGGVLRVLGGGPSSGISLFALSRGGLAPAGTQSAGLTLSAPFGDRIVLDAVGKLTSFGERSVDDDWFGNAPQTAIPAIVRAGGRLTARLRGLSANVTVAESLSNRENPSGFLSGHALLSQRFSLLAGYAHEALSGSLVMGVDALTVDPDYLRDDARYISRTGLFHPYFTFRLPGLLLGASYGYLVYRLPPVPVVSRRTTHRASVNASVEFGPLSVGWLVQPRIDCAEEGRILLREESRVHARLSIASTLVRGELGLIQSNDGPNEVEAELEATTVSSFGAVDLQITVRDRRAAAAAGLELLGKAGSLHLQLTVNELLDVDLTAPRVGFDADIAHVAKKAELSVSWTVRTRPNAD